MDRSGWSQDADLAASLVAAVSRTQLSAAIFPPIHPVRPAMNADLLTAHVDDGGVEGGIFRVPPKPGQCDARGRCFLLFYTQNNKKKNKKKPINDLRLL